MTGRRLSAPLLLGSFLLLILVFQSLTLRAGHDWGDDFAQYIHHAKNIALGIDYSKTGYLWNPSFAMLGPPTYPPVFPAMLAPVYSFQGLNLSAMKEVVVLSFVAALFMTALVFRRVLRPGYAAALLFLLGLNPYFWHLKDNVLSDLPFYFFVYVALLLILDRPSPGPWDRKRLFFATALGIACYLAYGTRSLGAVLLPTLLAADWIQWRRVTRVSLLALAIFLLMTVVQSVVSHRDSGYASILSLDPIRIARNVIEYRQYLSGLWNDAWLGAAARVLFFLFAALAVIGFWGRIRRIGVTPLEIFTALYALAILPWIATQGRYLVPLMPLYVGYALWTIQTDADLHPTRSRAFLSGVLLLAALGFASMYATSPPLHVPVGVGKPNAQALFDAVRAKTEPASLVVFQKPRALALFTDRRATAIQNGPDSDLWSYIDRVGASHVIIAADDREFINQAGIRHLVTANPGWFEAVYTNPEFTLYRIHHERAGSPS